MSTLELKGSIYDLIAKVTDEVTLNHLHEVVRDVVQQSNLGEEHPDIFKPTRETVTLDQLKAEQNFKGINRAEFDALAQELDIQESYQTLIEQV